VRKKLRDRDSYVEVINTNVTERSKSEF